jgi:hypothetical protein
MTGATLSTWARRSLLVAIGFLVASQAAALLGAPARVELTLGLFGFVLQVVFAKAYSLVPSYYDRTLRWPVAPVIQLPLTSLGAALLALGYGGLVPAPATAVGAAAWGLGVLAAVVTIVATIWDDPTGSETGTSEVNEHRQRVDRLANAFMPVAVAYILAGSYVVLSVATGLPSPVAGRSQASHLLAAGGAAMLLFAVGFRLLPRFLVTDPPRGVPQVVLPAGALGPLVLAGWFLDGWPFLLGAVLESVAVGGFAVAYLVMVRRTAKNRVGFHGPLLGVLAGLTGVGLGLMFATAGPTPALIAAHRHLNVFGFLGLTIVGVLFQFYPPAVGAWPGGSDRTALAAIVTLALGVGLAAAGPSVSPLVGQVGHLLGLVGALGVWYLVGGVAWKQAQRG